MATKRKNYPPATYEQTKGGPLEADKEFYQKIADSVKCRLLVKKLTVPIRSGLAWPVKKGQICRIVELEGPQVGDFNVWNLHDPREHLWATRTRQLQSSHVSIFDRLWSNLPFLRPLLTVTGDSLAHYGIDSDGGRVHDLLGTRCDPYVNRMLTGTGHDFDYNCHSNLVRAILPYGLTEFDVHDVLNVFQVTGLNDLGKYYMKPCPGKKGDYWEFFAEIDLLCAISACPSGDQSLPIWGPDSSDEKLVKICRPLGVEIYELDPKLLEGWESPEIAKYKGMHGLKFPKWGEK